MTSTLHNASSAFAVSLLLVANAASASKPAAMKAAKTARGSAPAKQAAANAKLVAEKAATPAETQTAAVVAALEMAKGTSVAPATSGIGYKIGRAIGSASRVVLHSIDTFKAFRMRNAETRAAKKDFKTWLNRENHAEIRTYLKGARSENNVTSNRVGYWASATSTAISSGLTGFNMALGLVPMAAFNGAATAIHFGANRLFASSLESGIRKANTQTVDFAVGNQSRFVAAARLDRWAKAGIIDAKYERAAQEAAAAPARKAATEPARDAELATRRALNWSPRDTVKLDELSGKLRAGITRHAKVLEREIERAKAANGGKMPKVMHGSFISAPKDLPAGLSPLGKD